MSSKQPSLFFAAYFGILGVLLPFLGPFLELRGIGAVGIGLITAAVSLAKLVYAPLVGVMVDRGWWVRGMLVLHALLAAAAAALVAVFRGPWLLGAAFFVMGLGYATVLPLVEAAILERRLHRGYGGVRVWGSVGFIVMASVAAPILTGERLVRFPWLLVGLLVALAGTCVPFEQTGRPRGRATRERLPREVLWLLALLTLNQLSHGPFYAFFSIHLLDSGWGSSTVGLLWSIGVVAESTAFFGGSWLERRFGLRRLLGIALLLAPVRWILLALPPSLPLLVLAQLLHAATFALAHLAGIQLVQRAAPESGRRRAQALYSGLAFGLGIVAGSALAGPAYGAWGASGMFLAAAVASALAAALWMPLAPRLTPRPDRTPAATSIDDSNSDR